MAFLPESSVEKTVLDQLRTLDYGIESEDNIGPDGRHSERESHVSGERRMQYEDAFLRGLYDI